MKWILIRRRKSGHPFVIHCINGTPGLGYIASILAAHVMRNDYTADDAKTFCAYLNERKVAP